MNNEQSYLGARLFFAFLMIFSGVYSTLAIFHNKIIYAQPETNTAVVMADDVINGDQTPQSLDYLENMEAPELPEEEWMKVMEYSENRAPEDLDEQLTAADGTNIETLTARWSSAEDIDDGDPNNLIRQIHGSNNPYNIQLTWSFALSSQHDHPVGSVQFKIPKQIFRDRSGNLIGDLTLGVPQAPDTNGTFAYTDMGDHYILTNTKVLSAATSGTFDATIRNITPMSVRDLETDYKTDPFIVEMSVLTNNGATLYTQSEALTSQLDTKAEVENTSKTSGAVLEEWGNDYPSDLKPENHEDYIYATWTISTEVSANQPYKIEVSDQLMDEYNGALLGLRSTSDNQIHTANEDGVIETTLSEESRRTRGRDFYATVYAAYPKEQFRPGEIYTLTNEVTYTLTALDDREITTSTDTSSQQYRPVEFFEPEGHFYVEKYGRTPLPNGINKLENGEEVDLSYRINSRAFGMPWTKSDGSVGYSPDDYGDVNYQVKISDTQVDIDGTTMEGSDEYVFTGVEFSNPEIYTYGKYDSTRNGYNENQGAVQFSQVPQGQYGYILGNDDANLSFELFATVNGEDISVADLTYSNGNLDIQTKNGASLENRMIKFPENTTYFHVVADTNAAAIIWDMYPVVRVKPEAYEAKATKDLESITVDNTANMDVSLYDESRWINSSRGRNVLERFRYGISLDKELENIENEASNMSVKFDYKLTSRLQTNAPTKSDLNKAIEDDLYVEETGGTFYDLLPEGATLDRNSVSAPRRGDQIVSIEEIEDYKGSGRTLVKFVLDTKPNYKLTTNSSRSRLGSRGLEDAPQISYSIRYDWASINSIGNILTNNAAYESHTPNRGTVNGLQGEPDNPASGNHRESVRATEGVQDIMTDLNPEHDNASFVYARERTESNVVTYAITSLRKLVDVDNNGLYGDGLDQSDPKNVYEGGRYTYSIRVGSAPGTITEDIILYDKLDGFTPTEDHDDFGDTQWSGTFESINLAELRSLGIEPVVYYSTQDNLVLDSENDRSDLDLSNSAIWSTERPEDKTTITAIAVDASTQQNGEPYGLPENETLGFTINMRAPYVSDLESDPEKYSSWFDTTLAEDETEAGLVGGAHAYNNISMTSTSIPTNNDSARENLLVRHDYTKVGLKPFSISAEKTWNDDNDRDGIRPDEATLRLFANNQATNHTLTLNDENDWRGEFGHLPYQDESGRPISYSIREDSTPGYTLVIQERVNEEDGNIHFVTENYHEPERVRIQGSKYWDTSKGGSISESITVEYRNAETNRLYGTSNVYPDDSGEWTYTSQPLYRFEDGVEIPYIVSERYVEGFISSYDGNDITNIYNPHADLIIEKQVLQSTSATADTEFEFRVEFMDRSGNPDLTTYKYKTNQGRTGEIATGSTLKLKAGESARIKDIQSDGSYTIEEVNIPDGWSLTNAVNYTGTLRAGDEKVATFTNTYEPEGSFIPSVRKDLVNRSQRPFEFRFELSKDDEVLQLAANQADGSVVFRALNYGFEDIGQTYTYTLRELDTGRPGVIYDENEYTFTVSITDNGDGTLNVEPTYPEGGEVLFENVYTASGSVNLSAQKVLELKEVPANLFEFELIDDATGERVSTAYAGQGGRINFDPIEFTEQDIGQTFTYRAKEITPSSLSDNYVEELVYDESEILYTIEVFDNGDGTLSFSTTIEDLYTDDINNKTNTPVFVNRWKDGSLVLRKELVGPNTNPENTFLFEVELDGPDIDSGTIEYERRPSTN